MSECVRRMNWGEYFAPVLTTYMERMKKYRWSVLVSAMAVYDSKQASDIAGLTPLNRPRFEKAKRRKDKI